MQPFGIILSGSSGYLGSAMRKALDPDVLLICNKNSFLKNNAVFFNVDNEEIQNITSKFSSFIIIHLATYYSKNPNKKEKIDAANLIFSKKLLKYSENINLKKFIYTNTMFNFYSEESIRNLHYVNTKMQFSKILSTHSKLNGYLLDEIYLDNTFGGSDSRDKIIPILTKAVNDDKISPVVNKNTYINLIYYEDVINRIIFSINNEISGSTAFINHNSINLESIYQYLKYYSKNQIKKKELLHFELNHYKGVIPQINHYNLKVSSIEEKIIDYLNRFQVST